MRKKGFAILCAVFIFTAGCSARGDVPAGISRVEECPFSLKQISLFDGKTGWALSSENQVLFTEDGPESFTVIREIPGTGSQIPGPVSAAFPDEHTAYTAYFSPDQVHLIVESTADRGASWQQTSIEYSSLCDSCDAGNAYLGFTDSRNGYLLYCSTPAAGKMTKILLRTADGGKSFSLLKDLSEEIAGYPQGICFEGDRGYIAVSYHGEDSYLYTTSDGGLTWEDRSIFTPEGTVRYVDGFAPVFCPGNHDSGMIVLKSVSDFPSYRLFLTEDGGENWSLAMDELPWDSFSACSYAGEGRMLFLDGEGQLYTAVP